LGRLSGPLLGAAATALVFASFGGASHLGSLQLGHSNSADETTKLSGAAPDAELVVINSNGAAGIRAESKGGRGIVARHTNGMGTDPGVLGITASAQTGAAGVRGEVAETSP